MRLCRLGHHRLGLRCSYMFPRPWSVLVAAAPKALLLRKFSPAPWTLHFPRPPSDTHVSPRHANSDVAACHPRVDASLHERPIIILHSISPAFVSNQRSHNSQNGAGEKRPPQSVRTVPQACLFRGARPSHLHRLQASCLLRARLPEGALESKPQEKMRRAQGEDQEGHDGGDDQKGNRQCRFNGSGGARFR
jgi:hypothetical protein